MPRSPRAPEATRTQARPAAGVVDYFFWWDSLDDQQTYSLDVRRAVFFGDASKAYN